MAVSGIICGLGNPGSRYALTRHNMGFMVMDELLKSVAGARDEKVLLKKESSEYILWEWSWGPEPRTWLLIKPMIFMNRSGAALARVFPRAFIPADHLLVIHDEVDLAPGKVRIKKGGGLAGHNGLKSIAQALGTRDFVRLRLGVGRPEPGLDLSGYVLSNFLPQEQVLRDEMISDAVQAVRTFCRSGIDSTRDLMARISGRSGRTQPADPGPPIKNDLKSHGLS